MSVWRKARVFRRSRCSSHHANDDEESKSNVQVIRLVRVCLYLLGYYYLCFLSVATEQYSSKMDRGMLARATEGTDAPTPGYLYNDLTKAASSNPMACQEIARYLSNRLQSKQNPNIKAKCCKVIAKLADGVPRNQFRRAVAQDASAVGAIKEAMNFRGPMDPVRGDEPNARVRQAAKEALDAVYREAPTAETSAVPTSSYAPSPHANGGYSSSSAAYPGGRRMEGVGNPMFSDPRNDPRYNGTQTSSFKEVVREAGDVLVGMIKDPLARNIPTGPPQVHHVPRQGHSGDLPGYNRSQVSDILCCEIVFGERAVPYSFIYLSLFLFHFFNRSTDVLRLGHRNSVDKQEDNGPWHPIADPEPSIPKRRNTHAVEIREPSVDPGEMLLFNILLQVLPSTTKTPPRRIQCPLLHKQRSRTDRTKRI